MNSTPISSPLTLEEKNCLLKLARQSIEIATTRKHLPPLQLEDYTQTLQAWGASFVTLTDNGNLRGCIGALEPYQPLVEDVREHAVAAALEDYRFPPVRPSEVPRLEIEISRLTAPVPLEYTDPAELPHLLRPGIDGVVLRESFRRATFLPQVWEKLPDPKDFLSQLCYKMGVSPEAWRSQKLVVLTYQVEEFHE